MKVLLVDDDSDFLNQAQLFLKDEIKDLNVETTTSPKKALKMLEVDDYDAVVSDYLMIEIDGLDFLETLREEKGIDIPFIFFTGKGREEVAMEALNLGANRYLRKGGELSSQYGVLADAIVQEIEYSKAEEELGELEEMYERITEGSPNGIYIFQDGEFKFVNETLVEMTGYSREELKNLEFLDLVHPDFKEEVEGWTEKAFTEDISKLPQRPEFKALRKDGNSFWVRNTPSLVEYEGEPAIVGNVADITERKEKEKELLEAKRNYQELFEKSAEALFVHDPDTAEIQNVNQKMCDMYGYPREEALDLTVGDLSSGEYPYTQKEAEKRVRKAKLEGPQIFEWRARKKDGDLFWAEVTLEMAEIGGEERILGSVRDITKRKEVEEKEEFLHSLLRHDLRNKIQVVEGYLEKLKKLDLSEKASLYLEVAIKTTKSGKGLIEKVRALRKMEEEEVDEVEISSILDRVFDKYERVASEEDIELECDGIKERVQGGPLLEDLFSNLLENSVNHSACDRIWVTAGEDNGECVVSVIDDGDGVSDEIKDDIFNRGFKEGEGSGFGLGLYLVKEIIDDYNGEIEVKDSEYGGARFDVYLQKA